MKKETKEEVNKHLDGFKEILNDWYCSNLDEDLKNYQKKHNLIPSIEVGKIYKDENHELVFKLTKIDGVMLLGYGFEGKKFTGLDDVSWGDITDRLKEISEKEWESILLEKANKDYPKGTKYYSADDNKLVLVEKEFEYFEKDDSITDGCKGYVYYGGKWAEIVEEVKTEETEKETIIRIPKGVEFEFKVK